MNLEVLRQNPSGVDLGPLAPSLPERLLAEDGKIHCDVPQCLADLERAREVMEPVAGLSLIGRRHVRSNNSWMHNYKRLVKGKDRCVLLMHPDDLRDRQIADGATVRVSSRVGAIEVAVAACEDMMPGVVCLPHGYGHHRNGIRLHVAETVAGVSLNDLTDELADDPVSGNAVLNGIPVEVVCIVEPTSLRHTGSASLPEAV